MIRIEGRALTYGEVWFDEEPTALSGIDVLIYRQRPQPVPHRACTPGLTLVSNLDSDERQLMEQLGSTTRYEIKRAQRKDGLSASVITPTSAELASFSDFYDVFARQKSLEPAYRRGLFAAAQSKQLVLTIASACDQALIWHAYICCGCSTVLLYSASQFRQKSSGDRALIGRANRWLHWHDMLHFKAAGVTRYDWGGLFADESSAERAGINRFKIEFGGQRETIYNCTLARTTKGRVYLSARDALALLWRR